MDKQEDYIRIPREKQNFYKRLQVDKDIRILIRVVNYLQKESK